jgi:hypothetical protein
MNPNTRISYRKPCWSGREPNNFGYPFSLANLGYSGQKIKHYRNYRKLQRSISLIMDIYCLNKIIILLILKQLEMLLDLSLHPPQSPGASPEIASRRVGERTKLALERGPFDYMILITVTSQDIRSSEPEGDPFDCIVTTSRRVG